jgi:hypothetical protein
MTEAPGAGGQGPRHRDPRGRRARSAVPRPFWVRRRGWGGRASPCQPRVGGRAAYDGRATKEENFSERTGLAGPDGQLAPEGDGPVADVRYLDVLPLPGGGYRLWYEAPLPDGSHELRTELIG